MPVAVLVALALSATPRAAPPTPGGCGCPDPETAAPGLLWRGPAPLAPAEIAQLGAPIVWFSRDEPLIVPGATPPPDPHPCDAGAPRDSPVVYWSIDRVQLRTSEQLPKPVEGDARLMVRASGAVFRESSRGRCASTASALDTRRRSAGWISETLSSSR